MGNGTLHTVDRPFRRATCIWQHVSTMCISFDLVIPLLGIYPKINGQDVYRRMFVTQLFIIEKKF